MYGSTTKKRCGGDERDCMRERWLQRKVSDVVKQGRIGQIIKQSDEQGKTHYWGDEGLEVRLSKEEKSVQVK
jgi:hypothetical protein